MLVPEPPSLGLRGPPPDTAHPAALWLLACGLWPVLVRPGSKAPVGRGWGLELRAGGDGKQVMSVCPPTPGADGAPRRWADLGPVEAYGKGGVPDTPFREDAERLPAENFYYAQEDDVFAAAARDRFAWTVHRPHTIIGYAVGNAMNMGVTLAAYASLCKHLSGPFLFPGSPRQWDGLTDVTDARLLARHLAWAATTPAAANRAFNVVNGDVFRWRWLWPRLAAYFGAEAAPYPGRPTPWRGRWRATPGRGRTSPARTGSSSRAWAA